MHNPDPVMTNETLKVIRDLEIQIDHIILPRRPNLEREPVE